MKKVTLLLALFITTALFAQEDAKYGFRIGLNVSNLDFDGKVPTRAANTHRNGLAIGFVAEYPVTETFSLIPELQFSAEGAKENIFRKNFIKIPLIAKFKVANRIGLGLGPQVSFKATDQENDDALFNYSGLAYAEYYITDEIYIDVRYSYGFRNVVDTDVLKAVGVNPDVDVTSTNIQFGIGIKI